jgi:hypothetical protein
VTAEQISLDEGPEEIPKPLTAKEFHSQLGMGFMVSEKVP